MITKTFANRKNNRITTVVHTFDKRTAESIVTRFNNTNAKITGDDRFECPTFMVKNLEEFIAAGIEFVAKLDRIANNKVTS